MRRIGSLSLLVILTMAAFQGVAAPAEVSALQIDAVTVGSNVTVSGTLALGTDATVPPRWEPTAPATPPRPGSGWTSETRSLRPTSLPSD